MGPILSSLSLAEDLANGNPPETALRAALIALRLLQVEGWPSAVQREAALVTLLRFLGCTSYASEEAQALGDDLTFKGVYGGADSEDRIDVLRRASQLGGDSALSRARSVLTAAMRGPEIYASMVRAQCETAALLGQSLAFPDSVCTALTQVFERVDGRGLPAGLVGEQIAFSARAAAVAYNFESVRLRLGLDAACQMLRQRAGAQLDAHLAHSLQVLAPQLQPELERASVWELVCDEIEAPPGVDALQCARAMASFADLKSRFTVGHSQRVARLARSAAGIAAMSAEDRDAIETAALLMNIGMCSVSSGLIEKPGPLSRPELDRIHLHTFYTERILSGVELWQPAVALAAAHHERPDGSGYHRGRRDAPLAAALLSACDALTALHSPRAWREAQTLEQASQTLQDELRQGRRDGRALKLCLEAAGLTPRRSRAQSDRFGLTDREREVLRAIASGLSNGQIAGLLGLSARTVQHHSIRIYGKLGVQSRAAATLIASQQGLLHDMPASAD